MDIGRSLLHGNFNHFPSLGGPLKNEIAAREYHHLVSCHGDYVQDIDARGTLAPSSTGAARPDF
jgi:hypothetical protein